MGGKRVSVTTPEEERAGVSKISLEQARQIETQARQEQAAKELQRLRELQAKSTQTSQRELIESQTRARQLVTYSRTPTSTIVETKNLDTGEVEVKEYTKGRLTGGVIIRESPTPQKKPKEEKIITETDRGKYGMSPSVGLPTSDFKIYERGFGESTKEFFKTLGADIGKIGRGVFLGRDISGLRNPFEEFRYSGVIGKTEVEVPVFGTPVGVEGKTSETKTLFELQRETQLGAGVPFEVIGRSAEAQEAFIAGRVGGDIRKEFQGKVDTGELSVEEAQRQASEKFQQEFEARTKYLARTSQDLTKTTGERLSRFGTAATLTATVVAGSAFIPPASFAAGSTLLGIVGEAKGQREISQTFLGAGLISSITAPGAIAREIDVIRLQELRREGFRGKGVNIILGKDESISMARLTRGTEFATQKVDILSPALRTGSGVGKDVSRFSIGGGRGFSTTTLESFERSIQGYTGTGRFITSTESFSLTAKGLSGFKTSIGGITQGYNFNVPLKGEVGAAGRFDVVTGDKVTTSPFASTSKIAGKYSNILGGRTEEVLYSEKLGRAIKFSPKSELSMVSVSKEEVINILKKYPINLRPDTGSSVFDIVSGKNIITEDKSSKLISLAIKELKQSSLKSTAIKSQETFAGGVVSGAAEIFPLITKEAPTITETVLPVSTVITIPKTESVSQTKSLDKTFSSPQLRQAAMQEIKQESKQKVELISIPKQEIVPVQKTSSRSAQIQIPQQKALVPKETKKKVIAPAQFIPITAITPTIRRGFEFGAEEIIKPKIPFFPTTTPTPRRSFYQVEERRYGKFSPIGQESDIGKAFQIGIQRVGGTLGATFRITGAKKIPRFKTPKGFISKQTKRGLLFIEKPSLRLSTATEIKEIQKAKKRKKKKRKKR